MRKLVLLLLLLGPGWAQDDDDPEIEIDKVPPPEKEEKKKEPRQEEPEPPPPPKPAKPKLSLQMRINLAIDKGVAWLKRRQSKSGSYGPCVAGARYDSGEVGDEDCYRIGPTAFTVFTLRKCGLPRTDPTIKASVKWLRRVCRRGWTPDRPRIRGTQFQGKGVYRYTSYESAAIIMMLVALNAKETRPGEKPEPVKLSHKPTSPVAGFKRDEWRWMHERVCFLIHSTHSRMPQVQIRGGGWRYWPPHRGEADQDLSATQFALLGLRAAVSAGYPVHLVESRTWEWAAQGAESFQRQNGGFSYRRSTPWTAGMTAAGIACLLICKEQIRNIQQAPPTWIDGRVERAFEFLGKNLDFTQNRYGPGKKKGKKDGTGYHYYHLYGIERVGALSGRHEIGGQAWYPRGAQWLVEQQQESGAWKDETCMRPRDVLGTCFALLFLKKATPPAVTVSAG